jgi:hypothetical protein
MWNPAASTITDWVPFGGWPAIFSPRDRIACASHYEYLVRAGRVARPDVVALKAAYKAKYPGLKWD